MSGELAKPRAAGAKIAWAWAALLAVSLAMIAATAEGHRRHVAAVTGWQAMISARDTAAQQFHAEWSRDVDLLSIRDPDANPAANPAAEPDADPGTLYRSRRRNELELALFPERAPPTTLPVDDPNMVIWADETRGLVLSFRFGGEEGRWSSMHVTPMPSPPPPPPPRVLELLGDLNPYRQRWVASDSVLAIGPMLWIALLIVSAFWKRDSRRLAHAHLAVAWLCLLGWLLNPQYPITRSGLLANKTLISGMIMLLASVLAAGYVMLRRRAVDPNRCRACDYDLTGNVSGICPECGAAIAPNVPASAAA